MKSEQSWENCPVCGHYMTKIIVSDDFTQLICNSAQPRPHHAVIIIGKGINQSDGNLILEDQSSR